MHRQSHQRPLLPATPSTSSASSTQPFATPSSPGRGSLSASSSRPLPPLSRHVSAACNACHLRKSKCNGERPICLECYRRETLCSYPTRPSETRAAALRRNHDGLERKMRLYDDFHRMLRDRPEHEVRDIIHRLRVGTDVESLVRFVETGDMLLQLQGRGADDGTLASALNELLSTRVLDAPPSPYDTCRLYRARTNDDPGPEASPAESEAGEEPEVEGMTEQLEKESPLAIDSETTMRDAEITAAMYTTSFNEVRLVSTELDAAKPADWTSVSSDNVLMRKIIEGYFLHDYPFTPCFNMNLFLSDMLHGRTRFCSSLLVNSVLAVGCHRLPDLVDRANFSDPSNLGYKFQAESRRLWDLQTEPSLCSIQAGAMLYLVHSQDGTDKAGWTYLSKAISDAGAMGLFDSYLRDRKSWRIVQNLTVWGIFGLQSFYSFHFEVDALMLEAPSLSPLDDPSEYGEVVVQYPLESSAMPISFGLIFRAQTELHNIIYELSHDSHGSNLSRNEGLVYLTRLKSWFEALPSVLQPANIVFPIHLQVHLHFHNILIALLEPFLSSPTTTHQSREESGDSAYSQPDAVMQDEVSNSKTSLQFLIRLYYRCHGFDTACIVMIQILMFIGFGALTDVHTRQRAGISPPLRPPSLSGRDISGPSTVDRQQQKHQGQQHEQQQQNEQQQTPSHADTNIDIALHSTIVLCGLMLQRLSRNFAIAGAIFRLLLSRLCAQDRARLEKATQITPTTSASTSTLPPIEPSAAMPQTMETHSEWLVNYDGGTRDERRLSVLLERYSGMTVKEREKGSSSES